MEFLQRKIGGFNLPDFAVFELNIDRKPTHAEMPVTCLYALNYPIPEQEVPYLFPDNKIFAILGICMFWAGAIWEFATRVTWLALHGENGDAIPSNNRAGGWIFSLFIGHVKSSQGWLMP